MITSLVPATHCWTFFFFFLPMNSDHKVIRLFFAVQSLSVSPPRTISINLSTSVLHVTLALTVDTKENARAIRPAPPIDIRKGL